MKKLKQVASGLFLRVSGLQVIKSACLEYPVMDESRPLVQP